MTAVVSNRCSRCGLDAEPTPAVMASGADHVACHFGLSALVASANGRDTDAQALALYRARRRLREIQRSRTARARSGKR